MAIRPTGRARLAKYTSSVIAWAPEDQPTVKKFGALVDAFEKTAWAGLEFDRYAWTAVLHWERGGGAHVHVLAARCDLETGRSLNRGLHTKVDGAVIFR
ncbi:MAG: hypothetical protein OXQ94_14345 [Gemmatimonadota bacterium]|nr:hypothetical protein [Gemmatimonadota bacterium]MDE2872855.1 hypothetical protein [Gemmatimonadota bacterium]